MEFTMSDLKSGEKFITNPDFVVEEGHGAKELCSKLNYSRLSSAEQCDLTIEVAGRNFSAHKIVMIAFSPYFEKGIYTSFGLPLTAASQKISLAGVMTADTFQLILDYAYTCKITITAANVEPLLRASCKLEVLPLKNICEEYLGIQIDGDNFVKMHELTNDLECEVLYGFLKKFIQEKFMEIWEGNTFLELKPDILVDIIKSDDLEVRSEETVFSALMRWTNHKEERKSFLRKALPHVRLGLLSTEFLIECMDKQDAIRTSTECMLYFSQVVASKLQPVSVQTQSPLFKPRRPVSEIEGLLFYEGSSHTVTGPLYFLSIEDGKVRPLKSAPFDDWSWIKSVAPAGGTIYALGDVIIESRCQVLLRYDMLSNKWERMITFDSKQFVKDIIDEYHGCLYIVTQFARDDTSFSLIEFDIRNKATNVLSRFSEYGKPCFRFGDSMYVTVRGTSTATGRTSLRHYNPVTNSWTELKSIADARTTLLCCTFQGKLFTFEGYPNVNATTMRPQIYDFSHDKWQLGAPLKKVHRRPAASVVLDGCLTFIDIARFPRLEIERYLPEENAWEACENQLAAEAIFDPERIQFVPGVVKLKPF